MSATARPVMARPGGGDGPASKSLRIEVPDLTCYAQRHGDAFDRDLVERTPHSWATRHRRARFAHDAGVGRGFIQGAARQSDAERGARLEITRLADYVRQLQRPSPASGHGNKIESACTLMRRNPISQPPSARVCAERLSQSVRATVASEPVQQGFFLSRTVAASRALSRDCADYLTIRVGLELAGPVPL